MYDVYVYASPGYLDTWSIRYWLYRVTVAARKTVAWTRIWVIGSGGYDAVVEFTRHHPYPVTRLDPPDPKKVVLEVKALRDDMVNTPDVLLAFTRGGDTTWEYATLAIENGVRVILTANIAGEDHN